MKKLKVVCFVASMFVLMLSVATMAAVKTNANLNQDVIVAIMSQPDIGQIVPVTADQIAQINQTYAAEAIATIAEQNEKMFACSMAKNVVNFNNASRFSQGYASMFNMKDSPVVYYLTASTKNTWANYAASENSVVLPRLQAQANPKTAGAEYNANS